MALEKNVSCSFDKLLSYLKNFKLENELIFGSNIHKHEL